MKLQRGSSSMFKLICAAESYSLLVGNSFVARRTLGYFNISGIFQ